MKFAFILVCPWIKKLPDAACKQFEIILFTTISVPFQCFPDLKAPLSQDTKHMPTFGGTNSNAVTNSNDFIRLSFVLNSRVTPSLMRLGLIMEPNIQNLSFVNWPPVRLDPELFGSLSVATTLCSP